MWFNQLLVNNLLVNNLLAACGVDEDIVHLATPCQYYMADNDIQSASALPDRIWPVRVPVTCAQYHVGDEITGPKHHPPNMTRSW